MMLPVTRSNSLSRLSSVTHGFFGRQGGVSEGLYASLNVGLGSDDDRKSVLENRRRIADSLHHDAHLLTLYQIHSAEVVQVDSIWKEDHMPQADAMVTDKPHVILGILTADCVPVLLADASNRVIGAAHAGWKGAIGGVLENTIQQMHTLGATEITAAIGPCIQQASYEVDTGFRQRFLDDHAENASFFDPGRDGHYHFDLPGYVKMRLQRAGIQSIDAIKHDTYLEGERYFSYRRSCHRSEPDYGRHLSGIMLNAA